VLGEPVVEREHRVGGEREERVLVHDPLVEGRWLDEDDERLGADVLERREVARDAVQELGW
jgi:hypothetical protein